MINTVNTLGASAPGFMRVNSDARKPDAGAAIAEAKPVDNLQFAPKLDGSQTLSDSRQALRNEPIPSASQADQADNETQYDRSGQTALSSADTQDRRETTSSAQRNDRSDSTNRSESRDSSDASERAEARQEAAQARSQAAKESRSDVQDDVQVKPENADEQRSQEATQSVPAESEAASRADSNQAVSPPANESRDTDEVQARAPSVTVESESNNRSETDLARDDLALSRPEQDGLRSFQQVAEVTAFEVTGTAIDVSI